MSEEAERHESSGIHGPLALPASLIIISHWEVKVGGTSMKQVRGARFAGSSPPQGMLFITLSARGYCRFHLVCPIWREELFLGLVQIEINLIALLSFCTKPRQSSSRQIFSREGGGSKPSGIDNSPRTQKKSYGTSTQVCTQANACTAVVQADLEAVACNHCSTKLNACCRLFTLETGPQSPVYGVHSTASVPQL